MATLEQNTAHTEQALDRLLSQFKDKPKLAALIAALVSPLQEIENILWSLYTDRWIDKAEGIVLDNIGKIVQQDREGRSDGLYRKWIQAKIIINRSNANGDDTLKVAELTIGTLDNLDMIEEYPAAYVVRVTLLDDNAENIFKILSKVKPAGVTFFLEYTNLDSDVCFTFASGNVIETSTDQGFADLTETTGGRFVGAFRTEVA